MAIEVTGAETRARSAEMFFAGVRAEGWSGRDRGAEPCFPGADPARWGYTLDLNLRGVMLAAQVVREPMAGR